MGQFYFKGLVKAFFVITYKVLDLYLRGECVLERDGSIINFDFMETFIFFTYFKLILLINSNYLFLNYAKFT